MHGETVKLKKNIYMTSLMVQNIVVLKHSHKRKNKVAYPKI